jgi:PAS domain S-box-containing protein
MKRPDETASASRKFSIVLIEDDDADVELILAELASAELSWNVVRATNKAQVHAALSRVDGVDAVLCGYGGKGVKLLRAIEILKASGAAVPLIVVSRGLSDKQATECMRLGATDYILKDDLGRLPHALFQAIQNARAERTSREVERSYRHLYENVPLAVFRTTPAGQILDANPAALEMFGFADLESMLATSAFDLYVDPDERRTLLARLQTEGHLLLDYESRMRRVDSSEFWFSRVGHIASEEDGRTQVWEIIGRDVSERKRAEAELAESEERLRSVLASAPVALATLDRDGRFTFVAGSVFSQFGLDPSSFVGLLVSEAFANRPDLTELWTRALEQDLQTDVELAGRTFHVCGGPFRLTPDGEVIGVCSVAFDNSERVEADRALRQSEEVFRGLFEQSAVGIALQDVPRDDLPGRVRWNSRMREMLGLGVDASPDDSSWTSAVTEDQEKDAKEKYSRLLSGEATQLRERRLLTRPDGKTVWADLSTVLVRDRDEQPLRFQTMALDITEQVEAEQRLSSRVDQETVLRELSRAGLEWGDTAAFLTTAVELVARGTETQFATILELRPSDDCLTRVASHGPLEGIAPDLVALDRSLPLLDALTSEMPVLTFDYQAQPEIQLSPWMIEYGVVASMAVTIRGPISPYGVLWVHSNVAREFSADDLEFMRLASTIISVAVERKRGEKLRRMLLGRLVTAQEAERRTIAEDIHDDAVQVMTAANMRLELFRMVLTDPVQVDAAQKLQETISLAIGRLRNLLFELIPPDLESHGLAAACRSHLEQFEADAGVRWELHAELDEEPAPQGRILLFRIFQEALINVRKHARATTVTVSLKTVDGGVMMRLSDDGAGFLESLAEPLAGHLGLASMRERAEIAGGWWRLTSEPGRGTEISTWVPGPGDAGASAARAAEVMAIG